MFEISATYHALKTPMSIYMGTAMRNSLSRKHIIFSCVIFLIFGLISSCGNNEVETPPEIEQHIKVSPAEGFVEKFSYQKARPDF